MGGKVRSQLLDTNTGVLLAMNTDSCTLISTTPTHQFQTVPRCSEGKRCPDVSPHRANKRTPSDQGAKDEKSPLNIMCFEEKRRKCFRPVARGSSIVGHKMANNDDKYTSYKADKQSLSPSRPSYKYQLNMEFSVGLSKNLCGKPCGRNPS